jgi:hypothetical protein
MRTAAIFLFILTIALHAYGGWEEHKKDVTIEEMGFSLTMPESWVVTPDEEGFRGFSTMDTDILCCPVFIEDEASGISIFIYATKRDDFRKTVMDMGRERAEIESDVLEIGEDIAEPFIDGDGNEYQTLRNLHLVNKKDLAYGVIFHRNGVRYEIYYLPWTSLEFGVCFAMFEEVLGTLRFIGE